MANTKVAFHGSTTGMTSREIRRASKRNKNPADSVTIFGVEYMFISRRVSKALNNTNIFLNKLK